VIAVFVVTHQDEAVAGCRYDSAAKDRGGIKNAEAQGNFRVLSLSIRLISDGQAKDKGQAKRAQT
jgi:hypothetical protein